MKKRASRKDDLTSIMGELLKEHGELFDVSFDFYCPKTYAHHNRVTCWMPVFYLGRLSWRELASAARRCLGNERAWRGAMRDVVDDKRLSRLVDFAHVERSLQRGYATLRLSTSRVKPLLPRLAGRI